MGDPRVVHGNTGYNVTRSVFRWVVPGLSMATLDIM